MVEQKALERIILHENHPYYPGIFRISKKTEKNEILRTSKFSIFLQIYVSFGGKVAQQRLFQLKALSKRALSIIPPKVDMRSFWFYAPKGTLMVFDACLKSGVRVKIWFSRYGGQMGGSQNRVLRLIFQKQTWDFADFFLQRGSY